MSQNHLVDSGAKSSNTPGLKPVLAAALASLEVQLDQELARYRRTRFTAHKTPNQLYKRIPMHRNPQQESAATTTRKKTQLPVTEDSNEISLPHFSTTTPLTEEMPEPGNTYFSQVHQTSSIPTVDKKPTSSTASSGSIVPAVFGENKSENVVQPHTIPKPPDDYLESSEALLRSLTEEQIEETHKRSNSSDGLLSPLGIGSILLLLASSLTLGYVVFNPKNLPQFSLNGLFARKDSKLEVQTQTTDANTQTQTKPQFTPIPKHPNLASNEFPEVKNPNDVVGLQPKPVPISTPSPVIVPSPTFSPIPTIEPQQPTVSQNPLPTAIATPSTKPEPIPPKLDDREIKPLTDGLYHVITDNQDNKTLAAVRQVVPDAYLSPEGKYIYLGALKTQEQVKQHLQNLEAKGIKARVQQP